MKFSHGGKGNGSVSPLYNSRTFRPVEDQRDLSSFTNGYGLIPEDPKYIN